MQLMDMLMEERLNACDGYMDRIDATDGWMQRMDATDG